MTAMRVLLATDGSEDAAAAAAWLASFPVPRSATILVLSVAALPPTPPAGMSVDELRRRLGEQGRRVTGKTREALGGRWTSVEEQVADGDPREEIVRVAEAWRAELVVLGARGLTGLQRVLVGSVSTTVVRYAHCPVLVVKRRRPGLRAAVLAVDGSPDSLRAADVFAALPLDPGLRLRLLAVVEPPSFTAAPEVLGGMPPIEEALEDLQADAEATLRRVEARFDGRVATIERSVVVGRPREHIVAAANDPGTDLVIVGARGLGTVKRLLLGSVSDYVLQHADCPVLIVRGRRL